MPNIVSVERPSGQIQIWENSTVFEFNPWEMGSYDPGNPAFAPLRYVGSDFNNGSLAPNSQCVAGVDNVAFITGTSSSLFNQAFLQLTTVSNVPDFFIRAINDTLAQISGKGVDIASWPNPFFQYNPEVNRNANSQTLDLVDGGEDLQNIPLHPLIWSLRDVDVIIAVDSSADTETHWPNGTALVATYQRSVSGFTNDTSAFPSIPDQNTFVNQGLNNRPTFFGCDPSNMTGPGPLVVYIPNAPYTNYSNVSTFQMEYTKEEQDAIILNGYNVATMANSTVDAEWSACVGCAILSRSFGRTKTDVPSTCVDCFNKFCWNGSTNATNPGSYEPTQIVVEAASCGSHRRVFSTIFYIAIASSHLYSLFLCSCSLV